VRKYGGVNKIKMITNKIGNGSLRNRVVIITFDEAVNSIYVFFLYTGEVTAFHYRSMIVKSVARHLLIKSKQQIGPVLGGRAEGRGNTC